MSPRAPDARQADLRDATPLALSSTGSLLRGRVEPAAWAGALVERGYRAAALADRDGLYVAVHFVKACQDAGIRPILGAALSAGLVGKAGAAAGEDGPAVALALCRNRAGYAALCRLLSARHLEPERPWEEVCAAAAREGDLHLVALSDASAERLLLACRAQGFDPLDRADGPDGADGLPRLWRGVATPRPEGETLSAALALEVRLGVPAVAAGSVNALVHTPEDAQVERLLAAVRANALVSHAASRATTVLEDAATWRRRWLEASPEGARLLAANAALASDCRLELSLGEPRFPIAPVPDGETPFSYLHARCQEGLRGRYRTLPRAAVRRLAAELEVIDRLGFTPYFVLVADIVGFAQQAGIPTVGRGSGAASLVAYLLGITNVDPLRYRLAFERFLHAERRDCPDLDIDLCWQRRDEVIEHVYRTYGAHRVAMISTHCTLGGRSAFREAAKAHGLEPALVDRLARFVPHEPEGPLGELLRGPCRRLGIDFEQPELQGAIEGAGVLCGLPDHLGIHPCGLVIADTALTDYTPLEEATKGLVVTQYEMRQIESLGLVKMDLLGNRCLTEIGDTVRRVAQVTGGRVVPRVDPPPDGDPKTAAMLRAGDALGVFQLESPGMRNLLRMLEAATLDDAIDALALIRPGPAGSGMKELYVKRKRGLEPVSCAHPRLEALLAPQRGILLYEEDVMGVVAAACDATLGQGDLFRRALAGTRTAEERAPLARWFTNRARKSGFTPDQAEAAWQEVARFGAYAFCRAHAAGYGVLAWQAAYLRAHWPAAFAVSLADHHAGMYALWVHLADLARHGVAFVLPCVNRSGAGFTLEGDPTGGPVRVGLARVRDVGERTVAKTLAERERDGAFASLSDWLGRVRPQSGEGERLVHAGAFDWTGRSRASLLVELAATHAAYRTAEDEGAFHVRRAPLEVPDLPEFTPVARLAHEWNALELGVTAHPLAAFAPGLWPADRPPRAKPGDSPAGFDAACDLDAHIGQRVRLCGLAAAYRRVPTKNGQRMFFLTLDDGTGLAECTLFPAVFAGTAHLFDGLGPYVVGGRVEEQYGAATVNVAHVEPWRAGASLHGLAMGEKSVKGVTQGRPVAWR